ncbi:MAG TPA: nicotinate phosphoribosyltransferase [Candidatus Sulfotelmatobacter sp.]|nr:nicotinate phosphoribosyltransferase [Candidatus Sulfotelmatobacter sp.]
MKATISNNGCAGALLTDLYQLTMACAYWKAGKANQEAVFELFFRRPPFQSGFTVAAGLAPVIDFLSAFCFTDDDAAFLATLTGNDGGLLLDPKFLDYLKGLRFTCDVHAIPEGTIVFPKEPLLRIQGPILQCQLLETAMLNLINFQTLVATKAARVCLAARGEPVLEFGLRRAQGVDGALAASRAAHIGGCESTSNVLAGKLFHIPVRGTHAHSWVMSFDDERQAFHAYAEAMPNNCVFLVDTYDTLEGVRRAIETGRWLRGHGHELGGIRLDSGDLAWLSIEARKILDEAGFEKAAIIASNNLDEHIIASLKDQGAKINVWGVGTKLVTAFDEPALGGVYKLAAVRDKDGKWVYKVKLSEQTAKVTNPGIHQVRRFRSGTEFLGDGIYDLECGAPDDFTIVDPLDSTRRKHLLPGTPFEDLLVPVFAKGRRVYESPPLAEMRRRTQSQLAMFHSGVKRFVNPHQYPVGLELKLHELKTELVLRARGER